MVAGRFNTGVSAEAHAVTVSFTADGITYAGDGIHAFWPTRNIVVLDRSGGAWRLTAKDDADCRLSFERTPETDAALKRLGVIGAGRDLGRQLGFGAVLIGAAAAVAAVVFVVIPMAAEPLAHATPREVESRLGENLSAQIELLMKPCTGESAAGAKAALAPVVDELYAAAKPGFEPNVGFVRESSPNAFAMPGGGIMITSGLLEALDRPEELEAVLAHEIGHVQNRDGMVALYRNAGLGILLELVTGGSGVAQQIVALGGQLAQLRYTRDQEERADVTAIATLRAAGRDPAALGGAFRSLKAYLEADEEQKDEKSLKSRLPKVKAPEWLKSHPDLDARIARAERAARPGGATPISEDQWAVVRAACTR